MRALWIALAAVLLATPASAARDAAAKNPHDFGRVGCRHCHIQVPGQGRQLQRTVFRKNIDDLCQECHAAALEDNLNHRVGIRPSMRVPPDLRLNEKGELSCITCHDPHGEYLSGRTGARTYFLRRQMLKRELCLACHAEANYAEPTVTVELVAPVNNAVVDSMPVPLIGIVSSKRVEDLQLRINDTSLVLSVRNGVFTTMLSLQEGINAIRIGGGEVVPTMLNILYNPALPGKTTYRLYRTHATVTRKDCFECHDREARGYVISANDDQVCVRCHERPPPMRYVHGPVAVGSCTVCHDPHGQTNEGLLVLGGEALCFQCHTEADVLRHLTGPAVGEAAFLRERGCTYCHEPHQSSRRYLLRDKI